MLIIGAGFAGAFCLTPGNSDRKKPLTLVGPKGLGRVVSSLRVIAPELPFELRLIELTNQQEHLSICGYEIDAFRVNHGYMRWVSDKHSKNRQV